MTIATDIVTATVTVIDIAVIEIEIIVIQDAIAATGTDDARVRHARNDHRAVARFVAVSLKAPWTNQPFCR
jgi:hypothetical protein